MAPDPDAAPDDLNAELLNLGFLLDAAAATPTAFDLETVLGRARRAVAALQAVVDLTAKPSTGIPPVTILRAIRRELPYGSPHE
ncbi:MAG TPA: hypothetical protein VGS62_06850 [Streptosporangiaceae bacterium]|nr:hypothetical protein [Streptosporangiaceae bacterium]